MSSEPSEPLDSAQTRDLGRVHGEREVVSGFLRALAEAAGEPLLLMNLIASLTGRALDAYCGLSAVSDDGLALEPMTSFDVDAVFLRDMTRLALAAPLRLDASDALAFAIRNGESSLVAGTNPQLLHARFHGPRDLETAIGLQIKSLLVIPLRARGQTVGTFDLIRHGARARAFDHAEVQLAQDLSAHAALALTNARLYSEGQLALAERKRLEGRLHLLTELTQEFSSAIADSQNLLTLVTRRMGELIGELCAIRFIQEDGEWLDLTGGIYHADPEVAATAARELRLAWAQRSGLGIAGRVAASGEPLFITEISPGQHHAMLEEDDQPVLDRLGITCLLAVPLTSRGGVFGVASLGRRVSGHPYTHDDLRLFQDVAAHASLAFVNGRLLEANRKDFADKMKTEHALRIGFLEAAPDAAVIVGTDGKIILVNSQTEALFGYARAEIVGLSVENLVPERFRVAHSRLRSDYSRDPKPRPMGLGMDLFALRKDGTEFAVEISLSPISTPDGTLVSASIRDVTERKREAAEQNQRVQEANRLKSDFLANMSHELRTPLNAIIGFAALMHGGKVGPVAPNHKEYLGDILNSSRHLLQLINDILDLAKVESGRIGLRAEHVELKKVVGEVRDILRGLAADGQIQLIVELDAALPSVAVDPRMLKQILYNFLSNAIKFTPQGGRVRLRIASESPESFRIEVEDTGIGIKPEDLSRLFVEFQQLDTDAGKKYPGTGLGLVLTKRVVEAQGGSVAVESVFGQGSKFSAILPRTVPDSLSAQDSPLHGCPSVDEVE